LRGIVPALVASAALLFPSGAIDAEAPASAALPACLVADAVLEDDLDSGRSRTGQPFRFTIVGPAASDGTVHGHGVVLFVRGARRGGGAGQLGLEARFVERADGTHVPATLVRLAGLAANVVDGRTRNAPIVLAAVGIFRPTPYQIAAGLIGAYAALHFGSQAVLGRGTPLRVALGDDVVTGACTLP